MSKEKINIEVYSLCLTLRTSSSWYSISFSPFVRLYHFEKTSHHKTIIQDLKTTTAGKPLSSSFSRYSSRSDIRKPRVRPHRSHSPSPSVSFHPSIGESDPRHSSWFRPASLCLLSLFRFVTCALLPALPFRVYAAQSSVKRGGSCSVSVSVVCLLRKNKKKRTRTRRI